MQTFLICAAAFFASLLTLFSGFGLGTLLMPVVAIFFPLEAAVALTAVVHLANNIFKLGLLGRKADQGIILRFGIPALVFALLGSWLLLQLAHHNIPLYTLTIAGKTRAVQALQFVLGVLIVALVLLEMWPRFSQLSFGKRWLFLGGALSGFFGGLSGHQGAFRSMFLLKAGLDKERFIATGVVLAVLVDVARLAVYGSGFTKNSIDWKLASLATLAAFAGAWGGARMINKVTLRSIRHLVALLLLAIGLALLLGFL